MPDAEPTDDEIAAMIAAESAPSPAPAGHFSYYDWLVTLTNYDLLQIFAGTGAGKTKVALLFANRIAVEGRKVLYLDSERNLDQATIDAAPFNYEYIASMDDLFKRVQRFRREEWDVIIIDSPTIFITEMWFGRRQDEHGKLLQELQAIYGALKRHCHNKRACSIITGQPTSTMVENVRDVMGDKAAFFVKECIYIEYDQNPEGGAIKRQMIFQKSRNHAPLTPICELVIDENGAHLDEGKLAAVLG